jgi:DNA-directed RNA polymerase specialized sigma24 family protein
MNKKEIIKEVKNGNNIIIDSIMSKNRSTIRKLFFKYQIYDKDIIGDLYSETILTFIEKCKNGLDINCKVSTYIYSIGKNIALKHVTNTHQKRNTRLNFDVHDTRVENIESDFLNIDEKTLLLRKGISKLHKREQELIGYILLDLKTDEIMKKMNYKNKDTLKTKKYRTLKSLKKIINEKIYI